MSGHSRGSRGGVIQTDPPPIVHTSGGGSPVRIPALSSAHREFYFSECELASHSPRRFPLEPYAPFRTGKRFGLYASAHDLKDLVAQFGNLGLAAGAYNAGEGRIAGWLADGGSLPWETQNYVLAITGRTIEEWSRPEPVLPSGAALLSPGPDAGCLTVASSLAKPGAGADLVTRITKAPWAPWGVQVAGNFSLNDAMARYSAMEKRYGAVLGGQLPMVIRTVNRSRGTAPFFQIRGRGDPRNRPTAIPRSRTDWAEGGGGGGGRAPAKGDSRGSVSFLSGRPGLPSFPWGGPPPQNR